MNENAIRSYSSDAHISGVRFAYSTQLCTSISGRETGNLARTYTDGSISALFRGMSFASVNFPANRLLSVE
jgi:hypothetical protein